MDPVYYAFGSIIGRHHVRSGKNSQDAMEIIGSEDFLIAVVADGCGSGEHSEVGAKLGVTLVARALAERASAEEPFDEAGWKQVTQAVMEPFRMMMKALAFDEDEEKSILQDYFLFTIAGVVLTNDEVILFGRGDGIFIVNGGLHELRPKVANRPNYLMYDLLKKEGRGLRECMRLSRGELDSLLISTDGIKRILERPDLKFPGTETEVGDINQLWADPRFLKHGALDRWLKKLNREAYDENGKAIHGGRLTDDTSIILITSVRTDLPNEQVIEPEIPVPKEGEASEPPVEESEDASEPTNVMEQEEPTESDDLFREKIDAVLASLSVEGDKPEKTRLSVPRLSRPRIFRGRS